MKRRGSTLLTALIYTTLGLAIAMAAAGVGMLHLRFSTTGDSREQARNLAESVLARGVAQVLHAETWGQARTADQTIRVEGGDLPEGAWGLLSFNEGVAGTRGVEPSYNNLGNPDALAYHGLTIPGQVVHLQAEAVYGGQRQKADCFLYVPPYPDALAASGKIEASALFVSAITDATQFHGDLSTVDEQYKRPGNIMSNSPADDAVHLGPGCEVKGNVQAVGRVQLTPGVRVQGSVRQGLEPQAIPTFPIDQYLSNYRNTYSRTELLGGYSSAGNLVCDWLFVAQDNATVYGDLEMKSGILVVPGDLRVTGKISGDGTIVCGGTLRVDQAGSFSGDNLIAILARGDIYLHGDGPTTSFVQGLVYTEGDLHANNLTVLGSVVANGPPGSGGLEIQNARFIQAPYASQTTHAAPFDLGEVASPYRTTDYDDDTIAVMAWYDAVSQTYSVNVKGHDNGHEWPNAQDLGSAHGLTYAQVVDFAADKYESFQGMGQGRRDNAGARRDLSHYFDDIRKPDVPDIHLDLRVNKVLDPAENARVLYWRVR